MSPVCSRSWVLALGLAAACGVGEGADGIDSDRSGTGDDPSDASSVDSPSDSESHSGADSGSDTDLPLDPCGVAGLPVLEVGTGEDAFEALTEGQDLAMVHGAQGGWHLPVALRAVHVPQFVKLTYRVVDVLSGVTVTTSDPLALNVALVPETLGTWACRGEYPNLFAYLDFGPLGGTDTDQDPWTLLSGRTVRLEATLAAADGAPLAQDSATVVVRPDPCDANPGQGACP